jgi:cation diffusion facilitator family transporter
MSSSSAGELGAIRLAVALYAVVFILKLSVYLYTGVMAVLAEALHTLADIFISGFLWVAARISARGADREHHFGHGRAQFVAALVAATLFISFTSFRLFEEAVPKLLWGHDTVYSNLGWAVGVLLVSMGIAAIPMVSLLRRKLTGAAAKAQLMELFNDQAGLVAALVGTLFIIEGVPLADPIATIVVAIIIAINAAGLFRENSSLLMGRSPDPDFLRDIEKEALSVEGVKKLHKLKAEYIGPGTVRAEMHIVVKRGMPIEEADAISAKVRERLCKKIEKDHCLIHVDPEYEKNGSDGLKTDPGGAKKGI